MPRHQHMPIFDPLRLRLSGSGERAGLVGARRAAHAATLRPPASRTAHAVCVRVAAAAALCMRTNAELRVADAYEHPSFNPVVDREGKFKTGAVLTVPLRSAFVGKVPPHRRAERPPERKASTGPHGQPVAIFGCIQLLNKKPPPGAAARPPVDADGNISIKPAPFAEEELELLVHAAAMIALALESHPESEKLQYW